MIDQTPRTRFEAHFIAAGAADHAAMLGALPTMIAPAVAQARAAQGTFTIERYTGALSAPHYLIVERNMHAIPVRAYCPLASPDMDAAIAALDAADPALTALYAQRCRERGGSAYSEVAYRP